MKQIIEKFIQSYFLWAANRPFKAAFVVALVFLIPALVAAKIVAINNDVYNAVKQDIYICFLAILVAFLLLNLAIPLRFMTNFFSNERMIVLLRPKNSSSRIYRNPIWGKVPYVRIYFPVFWDLNKDSIAREIRLEVAISLDEKNLANLTFVFLLNFSGSFQAKDLEDLIKEQKEIDRHNHVFHFQTCLQNLITNRCAKNIEKIIPHLFKCQAHLMTSWELTKELEPLSLFPKNFFANIEVIEMRLLPLEFSHTNPKKEEK